MPDNRPTPGASDKPAARDERKTTTAGRSADARGETGTDADFLAGSATNRTDMGGIPSTADSALSPSMSGSSDITSDGPIDRKRPTRQDEGKPSAKQQERSAARPEPSAPEAAKDEGPLKSLGKAVSAPVLGDSDDNPDKPPT